MIYYDDDDDFPTKKAYFNKKTELLGPQNKMMIVLRINNIEFIEASACCNGNTEL